MSQDDLTDAEAAIKALRAKLEEAYDAEQSATVAVLLAKRALNEAIDRRNDIARAIRDSKVTP